VVYSNRPFGWWPHTDGEGKEGGWRVQDKVPDYLNESFRPACCKNGPLCQAGVKVAQSFRHPLRAHCRSPARPTVAGPTVSQSYLTVNEAIIQQGNSDRHRETIVVPCFDVELNHVNLVYGNLAICLVTNKISDPSK
jgi:hypothetical protein